MVIWRMSKHKKYSWILCHYWRLRLDRWLKSTHMKNKGLFILLSMTWLQMVWQRKESMHRQQWYIPLTKPMLMKSPTTLLPCKGTRGKVGLKRWCNKGCSRREEWSIQSYFSHCTVIQHLNSRYLHHPVNSLRPSETCVCVQGPQCDPLKQISMKFEQ